MRFKGARTMEAASLVERALAQPLCIGCGVERVVDLRLFYPTLEGPAAVVPSLRAIGPGRDLSFGDTRSAFKRVI
jgi:hypothetical protein